MENDQKVTILNVDDNEAIRYAVTRTLRQAGFDVKEASNGRETLRVAEEQPDLILLDVNLPDINGFEVCKTLKNNPLTSHIPVLHLSATYLNDEAKVKGLETADGYLTQPVEPPVLIATIKALLRMKRAEEAVRESLNRWQTTFDGIEDSIFLLDKEGVIFQINKNAAKMFSKTEKEIQGHHCWEIVHGTSEPIAGCPIVRMKQSKQREIMLLPVNDKWYEVTVDPLLNQDGNLLGAVHIISDITESKRSEEDLRKSELTLRELFDAAPVGYHEVDQKGFITRVNRTELEMLGYSIEEMLGQPIWNFITEEENIREIFFGKIFGKIPPGRSYERCFLRKDGTFLPVLSEDRFLRDKEGKITGIRATIQDVSERKHAEQEIATLQEQFRQSQKIEAIGQLAGGIAHDFNNLLTIISGNAQLSLLDLKKGDPLRENIEEIRRASERAADLTRQLLAFSRKQIMEMKVLDLNHIVQGLDKMLHRLLGEDIELVTVLPEGIGKVKADPGQIKQVIVNLSVNARDAMIEGGKLTIETADVELDEEYAHKHIAVEPGRYVMLSVSDTGVGMTSEVKERIFEPFFTTKEMGKGTGLGLSTVYGIVKQSGGNIWVYSEPGQGTTFKIYLPQVDEPLEELREEMIGEVPGGSETVLVVEDEETVRKFAVRLLKKQGYKVLEAPDGGKAFMLCEEFKEPIHLILTDVVMPGMSGRKVAERLKQIHPEMKVLYMSGYTDNVVLHHGILEKGVNFVQKPFTVDGLARKVREALDK